MFPNRMYAAARMLLDWSKQELAIRAGISVEIVTDVESDCLAAPAAALASMRSVFEAQGIELIATPDGAIGAIHRPPH